MRRLTLTSLGGSIALDGSTGITARATLRGTGLPPVNLQWFEGAGDGATYRSARVLSRTIDLPIKVVGADRDEVWQRLSLLAVVLAPDNGPARFTMELDDEGWYVDMYRSGGGDVAWGQDTDGSTMAMTVVTLVAGDPYWQRANQASRIIVPGGLGKGLLYGPGSLSGLEVSTTTGLGSVALENTGDVPALPTWEVDAPFSGFTLTSPSGEVLQWTGVKAAGHIVVDVGAGTVVDETGANQYAALNASPRFWSIPPGSSEATVEVPDAVGGETVISVFWRPRKWLVF